MVKRIFQNKSSFSFENSSWPQYMVKVCIFMQSLEQQQGVVPDLDAEYRLFDRVVNVREGYTVPLGLRGTVIGIKGGEDTDTC